MSDTLRTRCLAFFAGLFALVFCQISFAESDSCLSLKSLVDSKSRDYALLNELKEDCYLQLQNGPNAKFIHIVSDLKIADSLYSANRARVSERTSLLSQAQGLMKVYSEPDGRKKMSVAPNQVLTETIQYLQNILSKLDSLSSIPFKSYIGPELQGALVEIDKIPRHLLSIQAMAIMSGIEADIKGASTKSDHALSVLDEKIRNYLQSSIMVVNGFQAQSNHAKSIAAIKNFQSGVAPAVLKIKATATWGKFLIQNKIDSILTKSDVDYAAGLVLSGREKLKTFDQLVENFFSRLPNELVTAIQGLDSYKKTQADNATRLQRFNSLAESEIIKRQREWVAYLTGQFKKSASQCSSKYSKFASELRSAQSDIENLEKVNSGKSTITPEALQFLLESMAGRLEILNELCAEFAS